ncbi:MAG: hypothetical protein WAV00_09575 [Nocardioides sp.]
MSLNARTDRSDGTSTAFLSGHPVLCGITVGIACFLALPISLYASPLDGSSSWPWLLLVAYAAVFAAGVALIIVKGRWRG